MPRARVIRPPPSVSRQLRRRRYLRLACFIIVALAVVSVIASNFRLPRFGRDDWSTFDRQRFNISRVISGDTLLISPLGGGKEQPVRLLGVDCSGAAAPAYWSDESLRYVEARTSGKSILLQLPPTQTRASDGSLLAYVHLSDTECLNLILIQEGQAYADRRTEHPLQKQFDLAETEARKKAKGLWKDVREEQMPPWRQAWLRELREARNREQTLAPINRPIK